MRVGSKNGSRSTLDAAQLLRARGGLLFAPDSVVFAIKFVDVISDDPDGTLDIGRTVPAAASAIDVASDRNARSFVIGVAVRALLLLHGARRSCRSKRKK